MKKLIEKYAGRNESPKLSTSMLTNVNIAEITIERITGKQDLK